MTSWLLVSFDMQGRKKLALIFTLLLLSSLDSCFTLPFSPISYAISNPTSPTIIVPMNYTTIQAAIDNAKEGDVIRVLPGKYVECLIIDKPLMLIGSGNATIIENAGGQETIKICPGVVGVTIQGFYINSSGTATGIYILRGGDDVIKNNVIANHHIGIHIYDSSKVTLRNNLMIGNHYNLRVWGLSLSHFTHDIDTSNLVNGKPVYYWINQHSKTVPLDAGYVAIVNSSNITVQNLHLSHNLEGVLLAYTNNSLIINVTVSSNERGLYMIYSHNNYIVSNTFYGNEWCGISTISSTNNIILQNTIYNNKFGIRLSHSFPLLPCYSDSNLISGNSVEGCMDGVYLEAANHNQLNGNIIFHNTRYGIVLDGSTENNFFRNVVRDNKYGVWIYGSNKNTFYWNEFLNNTKQVDIFNFSTSVNTWDNGYPFGGNYWSDYNGTDNYSGSYQNITGCDGIGDTPYTFDLNNQDDYPLLSFPKPNIPPIANFSFYPDNPRVNETIRFEEESLDSDGKVVLGIWNFESNIAVEANISRIFLKEGNYTVTLKVFDNEGAEATCTQNIFVRRIFSFLFLSVPDYATIGEEIEISAILLSEESHRLSNLTINFYLTDGNLSEWLGSSVTNSSGIAVIRYRPDRAGNFKIKASFTNTSIYLGSIDIKPLTVTAKSSFRYILIIIVVIITIGIAAVKVFRRRKSKT